MIAAVRRHQAHRPVCSPPSARPARPERPSSDVRNTMHRPPRYALVTLVVTSMAYPLAVTGIAQVIFPYSANGSIVTDQQGHEVGSELLGQGFPTRPTCRAGRPPTATTAATPAAPTWRSRRRSCAKACPTTRRPRTSTSRSRARSSSPPTTAPPTSSPMRTFPPTPSRGRRAASTPTSRPTTRGSRSAGSRRHAASGRSTASPRSSRSTSTAATSACSASRTSTCWPSTSPSIATFGAPPKAARVSTRPAQLRSTNAE